MKDEQQLDYLSTGKDSLLLRVGVRDNGLNPLADSTSVLVILDVANGVRRNLSTGESWFKVFPNPARETLHVHLSDVNTEERCRVLIYDIRGKLMEESSYADIQEKEIDISHLKTGIYLIKLERGGGSAVQRFVVME